MINFSSLQHFPHNKTLILWIFVCYLNKTPTKSAKTSQKHIVKNGIFAKKLNFLNEVTKKIKNFDHFAFF